MAIVDGTVSGRPSLHSCWSFPMCSGGSRAILRVSPKLSVDSTDFYSNIKSPVRWKKNGKIGEKTSEDLFFGEAIFSTENEWGPFIIIIFGVAIFYYAMPVKKAFFSCN